MLRAVLTVLIAVPMLMPPGMCLCQFASAASACSPSAPLHDAGHPASVDCCCDSCRERAGAISAVSQEEEKPRPSDRPASPHPGKHAPGCPAALGDIPNKMATAAVTLHLDASPAVGFVSAVVSATAPRSHDRDIETVAIIALPLFISHCALLI